jgi:transketolase C-terminal domain/subunit
MIHIESTRIAAIEGIDTLMNTDKRYVMVFADSVKVFRAVEFVKKYPDRMFRM